MRCIFCKSSSNTFRSVEHILPESLGNTKTILPPGIVCDTCNNYYARKVEGQLLNSDYFKHARFSNSIPNKKGRIPPLEPLIGSGPSVLGMYKTVPGDICIYPVDNINEKIFVNHLSKHGPGTLYIPIPKKCDSYIMSRFLAKVGLELLASRVISLPGWEDEVIFKSELDGIRNYARYGYPPSEWQFYERRIYDEDHVFEIDCEKYEILNEMDLLFLNERYLFSVICIFGVEYVIDMVNPDISGYADWLKQHNYISPLYDERHKRR